MSTTARLIGSFPRIYDPPSGRTMEVREIQSQLSFQVAPISIVGLNQIGKTSLCRLIADALLIENHQSVCYINFQDVQLPTKEKLLEHFLDSISLIPGSKAVRQMVTIPSNWIVIIDEVEAFLNITTMKEFLLVIRYLRAHHGRFILVMRDAWPIYEVDNLDDSWVEYNLPATIGPLSPRESDALMERLLPNSKLINKVGPRLSLLAGGHPFLIRTLADILRSHGPDYIENKEFAFEFVKHSKPYCQGIWRYLDVPARVHLCSLAIENLGLKVPQKLSSAAKSFHRDMVRRELSNWGLINEERIFSPVFVWWLAAVTDTDQLTYIARRGQTDQKDGRHLVKTAVESVHLVASTLKSASAIFAAVGI